MRTGWQFVAGLLILASMESAGQAEWNLQKEKDGIRVYTSQRENSRLLAYRIETSIRASLEQVFQQAIDFEENRKYLETVETIRVLEQDNNRLILVYMAFDFPWPFRDRDFVNRMTIEPGEDTIVMESAPASRHVDPVNGVVRIREFSEQWRMVSQGNDTTLLTLQGYADPGGHLPAWVINRFMVREPHALVKGIKMEAEHTIPSSSQ